jgi:hypothetical protein
MPEPDPEPVESTFFNIPIRVSRYIPVGAAVFIAPELPGGFVVAAYEALLDRIHGAEGSDDPLEEV